MSSTLYKTENRRASSEYFKPAVLQTYNSQEDICERIARVSERYAFDANKPVPIKADDDAVCVTREDQLSVSDRFTYFEPNIFLYFKKQKGAKATLDSNLEKVVYKNRPLEANTIFVLHEALDGYKFLTTLKFEFCGLTQEHLRKIDSLLTFYDTIDDLSLNGNPIKEQNYFILLDHKLRLLSLKYCGINEEGVRKICDELTTAYDNCLVYLNLASNLLFDEGIVHIAKMLKLNRKLVSLNLADNKIRNPGLLTLLAPLQKFELDYDELILRRFILMDSHRRSFGGSVAPSSPTYGKKMQKYHAVAKRCDRRSSSIVTRIKSNLSNNPKMLDVPNHPLLQDSTEEDEIIYCKGNNVLRNLNLSYNRITSKVVPKIIDMLQYQSREMDKEDKSGLTRLTLSGNPMTAEEMAETKNHLQTKTVLFQQVASKYRINKSVRK